MLVRAPGALISSPSPRLASPPERLAQPCLLLIISIPYGQSKLKLPSCATHSFMQQTLHARYVPGPKTTLQFLESQVDDRVWLLIQKCFG